MSKPEVEDEDEVDYEFGAEFEDEVEDEDEFGAEFEDEVEDEFGAEFGAQRGRVRSENRPARTLRDPVGIPEWAGVCERYTPIFGHCHEATEVASGVDRLQHLLAILCKVR